MRYTTLSAATSATVAAAASALTRTAAAAAAAAAAAVCLSVFILSVSRRRQIITTKFNGSAGRVLASGPVEQGFESTRGRVLGLFFRCLFFSYTRMGFVHRVRSFILSQNIPVCRQIEGKFEC